MKNASMAEKETWQDSIGNAVWACIDYGRVDKAREYLQTYKGLGGDGWNHQYVTDSLERSILLADFDRLDVNALKRTSFWNPALEKYTTKLMNQIKANESPLSPTANSTEQMGIYTRTEDLKTAQNLLDMVKPFRFMGTRFKYGFAYSTAALALAKNRPKDAIVALEEFEKEFRLSAEMNFLLAKAYLGTGETQKAIKAADAGLADFEDVQSPGAYDLYHENNYRPALLNMKARILVNSGKLEPALQICNQLMEASPDWIAPKLLKLEIMRKLNNQQEVSKLITIISSQLEKIAP